MPESNQFYPWPYLDTLFDYDDYLNRGIGKLNSLLQGTEVAIIGAGAAGLLAARLLLQLGLKPIIYEASEKIGGRLYSRPFSVSASEVPVFAEMGAMRMPLTSRIFFRYVNELNLNTDIAFPDPGMVDTLLYYKNKVHYWKKNDTVPKMFDSVGDSWNLLIAPLYKKIHKPWMEGRYDDVQIIWQNYLDHYKGISFYEAIRKVSPFWKEEELNRFATLGIGTGGFGPLYHVCFTDILRIIMHRWEDNQMLIKEGVQEFAHRLFSQKVQTPDGMQSLQSVNSLHLNTPISQINLNPLTGNPEIGFYKDNKLQIVGYKAVIVATTTRAMQFMGLSSTDHNNQNLVSEPVQSAIRNVHLINSSKLFIRTKEKFWIKHNLPSNIQTDELPRGVYLLDYPQTKNGVVCVSYTWGDDSAKLSGLKPDERFRQFKQIIHKISPEIASHLIPLNDEILSIDWQSEPFYYGAFKLNLPGHEDETADLFYQYLSVLDSRTDKGIYLAGDSVSMAGGWIEGALHTAINAATAAAFRCGASISKNSPLDINPKRYKYD